MKNRSKSGRSIARRLNRALTGRAFLKTLLVDAIAVLLLMGTWCFTVEAMHGGRLFNVSSRQFLVTESLSTNLRQFADDVRYNFRLLRYGEPIDHRTWTLPFDGVVYEFVVTESSSVTDFASTPVTEPIWTAPAETEMPVEGSVVTDVAPGVAEEVAPAAGEDSVLDEDTAYFYETIPEEVLAHQTARSVVYTADASAHLTVVVLGTMLLVVCQTIGAIMKALAGGGLIKRYLRPIDDLALMAEQLSSESDRAAPMHESARDWEADGILDMQDVASFADAINGIDDSRARVEMNAPELKGLEAAVNNMLKRLEEGRRKQIRFVDDASHELRTPIAVIQGYANMLDRWGKEDPKVRDEAIAAIKQESAHMKTLIDQLLFLARGEMDRHALERVPIAVDALLAEILEESQIIDRAHQYSFIPILSGDEGGEGAKILGDPAMIKQSIRILCDNAVKYTPEGGTITLKATRRVSIGDKSASAGVAEICIEVADTGIGIPSAELPRIFDRFYRGANARADNAGGSGLGLSIARWIIEEHGGRMEAISSPGIGTKMTIILPVFEE